MVNVGVYPCGRRSFNIVGRRNKYYNTPDPTAFSDQTGWLSEIVSLFSGRIASNGPIAMVEKLKYKNKQNNKKMKMPGDHKGTPYG